MTRQTLRILCAQIALLAAASQPILAQEGTSKAIVQNDLASKGVIDAVVFFSTNLNGTNGVARRVEIGAQPVSASNPIPPNGQAEVSVENDHRLYKWAKLRYQLEGSSRQIFTAAFIVGNQGDTGRNHYMLQVILHVRDETGLTAQALIDSKVAGSFDLPGEQSAGNRGVSPPRGEGDGQPAGRLTASGTSRTGQFGEALQEAINSAQLASGGADFLVDWSLKSTHGRSGSLLGLREITVTIEYTVDLHVRGASYSTDRTAQQKR